MHSTNESRAFPSACIPHLSPHYLHSSYMCSLTGRFPASLLKSLFCEKQITKLRVAFSCFIQQYMRCSGSASRCSPFYKFQMYFLGLSAVSSYYYQNLRGPRFAKISYQVGNSSFPPETSTETSMRHFSRRFKPSFFHFLNGQFTK